MPSAQPRRKLGVSFFLRPGVADAPPKELERAIFADLVHARVDDEADGHRLEDPVYRAAHEASGRRACRGRPSAPGARSFDRALARYPRGRSLKDVHLADLRCDRRDELDRARPRPDHRDVLSLERILVIPAGRVHRFALERIPAGDVGEYGALLSACPDPEMTIRAVMVLLSLVCTVQRPVRSSNEAPFAAVPKRMCGRIPYFVVQCSR